MRHLDPAYPHHSPQTFRSESGDVAAIRQFAWIPQLILPASKLSWEIRYVLYFVNSLGLTSVCRALVEQFLFEDVIPLPKKGEEDEAALTERVLTVMSFLDEKSLDTLIGLTGLKSPSVPFGLASDENRYSCIIRKTTNPS